MSSRAPSRDAHRSEPPRGLTGQARADWAALGRPTEPLVVFEPAAVAGLPEPARRWVAHAIAATTPLRTSVELRMHGETRLGAWRPFTAVQRLTCSASKRSRWSRRSSTLSSVPRVPLSQVAAVTLGDGYRLVLRFRTPRAMLLAVPVKRERTNRYPGPSLAIEPARNTRFHRRLLAMRILATASQP